MSLKGRTARIIYHFTRNGESESDNRYAVGQINGLTMAEIIE